MNLADKQELHQLIDDCNNEILLTEVKNLLNSQTVTDWWDELTSEDKSLVLESEVQYEKGSFISHDKLVQQFEEWKKK